MIASVNNIIHKNEWLLNNDRWRDRDSDMGGAKDKHHWSEFPVMSG